MGSELCQAIVSPPTVQGHLLEGMKSATICHTELAGQLTALRAAVSSATQFVLGCSPSEALWVEVVDEMLFEFWG
jgi:hypothetical protein